SADAESIAPLADKLHDDLVSTRINFRQRHVLGRDPDESLAYRDVAAFAGDAGLDGRNHLVRVRIDARDRPVPLIEAPPRSFSDRQEPRLWSHSYFRSQLPALRIDAAQ